MSALLDRVRKLMSESEITAKQLTSELGLSNSSFTDWGKGKGSPSLDAVVKISDYFHVSIDFLVHGVETNLPVQLDFSNQKDRALLDKYHSLTPDLQDKLLIYAEGMVAAMPKSQEDKVEKRLSV